MYLLVSQLLEGGPFSLGLVTPVTSLKSIEEKSRERRKTSRSECHRQQNRYLSLLLEPAGKGAVLEPCHGSAWFGSVWVGFGCILGGIARAGIFPLAAKPDPLIIRTVRAPMRPARYVGPAGMKVLLLWRFGLVRVGLGWVSCALGDCARRFHRIRAATS